MHSHPPDVIFDHDGNEQELPRHIVEGTETFTSPGTGSTCVHGELTIAEGAMSDRVVIVAPEGAVIIHGTQNGIVHILDGGRVEIVGQQNGGNTVDSGGLIRIATDGVLAGPMTVGGRIENAGLRGNTVVDRGGEIIDLPGSRVQHPEAGADGSHVYHWEDGGSTSIRWKG